MAMRQIAEEEPARHVLSASVCGRCLLTSEHCTQRMEPRSGPSGRGYLGDLPEVC